MTVTPLFTEPTTPSGFTDLGYYSAPSLGDLDGDGDLDVLSPRDNLSGSSGFVYFENTTPSGGALAFTQRGTPSGLNATGSLMAPSLGDLDGDGDLDVLVGAFNGSFTYFENTTPSGGALAFTQRATPSGLTSGVGEARSAPSLADLDGDGDLDVLAGRQGGDFLYFENTTISGGALAFTQRDLPSGLTGIGDTSAPSLADLDEDGDLDVLAGRFGGDFVYFENGAAPGAAPSFTGPTTLSGLTSLIERSMPSVGDLDGDGDLDVLAGDYYGEFHYFENAPTGTPSASASADGPAGWHLLAAPASGATVDALLGFTHTQGFPGADYNGSIAHDPSVYFYDEPTAGGLDEGFRVPTSQSEAIGLGRGVLAYLFDDDDLSDATASVDFPKILSVTGARPLVGFFWGTGGDAVLSYTNTASPGDDGWNLLGNPFGSWFDWDAVELSGVDAPVYVYDDATDGYLAYSPGTPNGGGVLPGGVVGPFQGFFVHVTSAAATIRAQAATTNGGPLVRRAAPLAVGLEIRPEDVAQPARSGAVVVLGVPEAEAARDRLDAYALTSLAADALRLSTLVGEGDGSLVGLAIDQRPSLAVLGGAVEIPVSVQATGALAGARLVLSWPAFDTSALPEGVRVVLRDEATGASVDLATASEYAFTASGAAGRAAEAGPLVLRAPRIVRLGDHEVRSETPRFTLLITSDGATATEVGTGAPVVAEVAPNPARGRTGLRLTVPSAERVRVSVYDALGREVAVAFEGTVTGVAEVAVEAGRLAPGVYVVRVSGDTFAESRSLTVVR